MANRVRPRCPKCQSVMAPLFRKGPRGKAYVKVRDSFVCIEDGSLARGRRNARFA